MMLKGVSPIATENDALALFAASPASVADTVNVDTPAAIGVPPIGPPAVSSVRPDGSAPATTLQRNVPLPPPALSAALYGTVTCPAARAPPASCTGAVAMVIVIARSTTLVESPLSVARTVNALVPAADAVPARAPVSLVSATPAGSAPATIVQL